MTATPRELPEKWRTDRPTDPHTDAWWIGYLRAKKQCADELEAALAAMDVKAVAHQRRDRRIGGNWSEWRECSEEEFHTINRKSTVGAFEFESRRLFTTPAVGVDEAVNRIVRDAPVGTIAYIAPGDRVGEIEVTVICTQCDKVGQRVRLVLEGEG